jgi:hypothetical protein
MVCVVKQPQVKSLPPLDFDEFRKHLREDLIKRLNEPPDDDTDKKDLALPYANYIADMCADAYREKIFLIAEDVAREVAGIPRVN